MIRHMTVFEVLLRQHCYSGRMEG